MKAFVTGASGFIGSHLTASLLKKKWQVKALLHKSKILGEEKIDIVRGDIRDFQTLKKAIVGTDILFHCAAALGSALIDKKEFHQINVIGTENALQAAREESVKKIIHISSAGVLGAVDENETADESYPLRPKNTYDKTKLEGEQLALRFAREGMNLVIVRPGWVYGPGDRRTLKLVKAIENKRFILVTKGKTWQTPIYIDDLIDGIHLCAEMGKSGEVYNLAGEEVLSVKNMVETIASAAGKKIPPFSIPLFPAQIASWKLEKLFLLFKKEAPLTQAKLSFFIHPKPLSIEKARKELGFSPKTNFFDGMKSAVSWYRKHQWI